MKRTTKRAVIALDLQHVDVPGLVSFTRGVCKGAANNANLAAADAAKLPVSLADLQTAATTLETTHTTRLTTPSTANTRLERDQATTLMEHLTNVAAFIEGLANTKAAGDVTLAGSIIASFGFQLKKVGIKHLKGFEAESPSKGTVVLHVPPGEGNEVQLVQSSADGGKTWSFPIVVHGVNITFSNLKSGVEYLFHLAKSSPPAKKAKQVVSPGTEEPAWGDSVSCVVS
jgi:hypothetical protein